MPSLRALLAAPLLILGGCVGYQQQMLVSPRPVEPGLRLAVITTGHPLAEVREASDGALGYAIERWCPPLVHVDVRETTRRLDQAGVIVPRVVDSLFLVRAAQAVRAELLAIPTITGWDYGSCPFLSATCESGKVGLHFVVYDLRRGELIYGVDAMRSNDVNPFGSQRGTFEGLANELIRRWEFVCSRRT